MRADQNRYVEKCLYTAEVANLSANKIDFKFIKNLQSTTAEMRSEKVVICKKKVEVFTFNNRFNFRFLSQKHGE